MSIRIRGFVADNSRSVNSSFAVRIVLHHMIAGSTISTIVPKADHVGKRPQGLVVVDAGRVDQLNTGLSRYVALEVQE